MVYMVNNLTLTVNNLALTVNNPKNSNHHHKQQLTNQAKRNPVKNPSHPQMKHLNLMKGISSVNETLLSLRNL